MPPATLADVAARAGLNKASVSRIINGASGFNPHTRQRVIAIANELGYRPNALSRALAGAASMSIGVVVSVLDPIIVRSLQAIESDATAAGYRTYVVFSSYPNPNSDLDARAIQDLLARRVDALLVDNYEPLSLPARHILDTAGVPVVYLRKTPAAARFTVPIDRAPAIKQLAEHLLALGHRRVTCLQFSDAFGVARIYSEAFAEGFLRAGVELITSNAWTVPAMSGPSQCIISADYAPAIYDIVRARVGSGDVPTALLLPDDEWATVAMKALHDAGLKIPADVSVIGYDDHPLSRFTDPPLTTIIEPSIETARAGFEIARHTLRDKTVHAIAHEGFRAELVIRQSTGPTRKPGDK